jgi:protocatechuate 3,4-dioxygenase, beta subunit
MEKKKNLPRRKWIKLGLGFAAVGVAAPRNIFKSPGAQVNECKDTPTVELGPYPTMKYRNQADHDVDLTQVAGQNGTATGQIISVYGKVHDDNCSPVKGAIVEIWSANHYGKYHHEFDEGGQQDPYFQGWGQAITNEKGEYRFKTIFPGLYGHRTRHIHFIVSKRGHHELTTQLYFDGEERNKTDRVLNQLTHDEQMDLIRPLIKDVDQQKMEFNITIDRVPTDSVPGKVLAEYSGNYDLQFKETDFESFVNKTVGGPYEKIIMEISNEDNQIYMTLPFSPRSEILWSQKDAFTAWSFYHSTLKFNRNADGKVSELVLTWFGLDITGNKMS